MTSILFIVFLPLAASILAGFSNKSFGTFFPKAVTTVALFVACALSWPVFIHYLGGGEKVVTPVLNFIQSGDMHVSWSLRVDALTAVMLVVVTSVSALVHLYSWGYMSDDPDQPRFFAYLSLFTFAMLMLVTADNLIQMFFGWEGVGLASYLLIGFWFRKPTANAAAIKAFVVNRVGDLGFMLGIFGTFLVFKTVSIDEILTAAPHMAGSTIGFFGGRFDTMTVLCLLLFVGACGKSAQLGLHTWLPDAMEGPTPVSALIHAATMVTAGVFMVCRLSPMFEASPVAMHVVMTIGAATCLFAASCGLVQTDIKRVIAYSTCSQLGYMFFAAGCGAYGAAMFHLFTHAFFKALLFLGAGSVIHAMHHEQDMRYYGGLRKSIPITFWAMMAGTLAITGVGIEGVFGFAGFYSKDAIILSAWAANQQGASIVGILVALLTSFYSWRLMFLTFWGKPRWAQSEHIQHAIHDAHGHGHDDHAHDDHAHAAHGSHDHDHHAHDDGTAGYHPHESPLPILIPLIVLSIGAVFAGFVFHPFFTDPTAGESYWRGALAFHEHLSEAVEHLPTLVKLSATIAMLLGLVSAWYAYIVKPGVPAAVAKQFSVLYDFLLHKWYFDELYDLIFVKPAFAIGRFFWHRGDEKTINRFGPDGSAWMVSLGSRVAGRLQTGYLYTYAFVMLIGLTAAMTWAITR
ncbi:NADH-quinone oxidoreductase subunit L [Sphingomonas populi]|uniref:NADH-quinone oxidoreductase subunit L n=1 Tax=Sphingomonas populi TaxID=2484750 RepID=A0A4Q6XX05_9SPHN|nr:NADH-quinone oxidoreductase subunit L [Sphingomonas populi]RZF64900.1 NADH-quinone oxidoreductase subunit L [Sphingomonas populi]